MAFGNDPSQRIPHDDQPLEGRSPTDHACVSTCSQEVERDCTRKTNQSDLFAFIGITLIEEEVLTSLRKSTKQR